MMGQPPDPVRRQPPDQADRQPRDQADRYEAVRQYSLAQILGVWAAAALPMGLLAWVFAPLLRDQLGGDEPLAQALLILLTAGLIWQFILVLILVRRELGTLEWPRVRDALWLRPPRDPKSGRVGGRVWWWLIPFLLIFALEQFLPAIPGPSVRDFGDFLDTDRAEDFFSGAWGWYAVLVVLVIFNTVLGEELLFRGLLLPRMKRACGKWDWVVNGVLFACYHLHQPWDIPTSLVDIFALSYPSKRFQSAWMGIIVHSAQSVVILIVVFTLVV
jgi:membrane protease YdiL (CAAX protease family)